MYTIINNENNFVNHQSIIKRYKDIKNDKISESRVLQRFTSWHA